MQRSPTTAAALGFAACFALLATACGATSGGGSPSKSTILIALNVPTSADPYVAGVIGRGAKLAVLEANQGGFKIGSKSYTVALKTYDDNGDPQRAASNVDSALGDGAVAVIEDGVGITASAARTAAAGVPEIDITTGDLKLLENRPSAFRLGIPNDAGSSLLGTYIAAHTHSVAILHDDSEDGRDGSTQLVNALMTAAVTPQPVIEVSSSLPTLDTQVQEIAAAHVGGVALWGGDVFIARAVTALRSAGLTTPIYTSQAGESPSVRLLAGRAATDGLTMVTSRMTSENDSTSFGQFEHRLAVAGLGPTDAGLKNSEGQEIRQPNDVDFFSYDSVRLVLAALKKDGSASPGQALLHTLANISITSANGDARGFDPQSHEAFAAADVYIAGIHDMQFEPVKDEQLSATLPKEDEILADFH